MANFSTHITVAAAGAGLLSVLFLQVGLAGPREAMLLALLGTIGGILPDIDLEHAYPSRIMFSLFGIIAAFLLVFARKSELSIVELWGMGLVAFAVIRFPVWMIFNQYTVHRGSIHSLVAALLFMFLTAAFAYHVMGEKPFMAWLFGLFVFLGFVLHLLLDELYSVDFMNSKIKKSFGTALKILDWKKREKSTALVVATILAWAVVPDSRSFWDTLLSAETYRIIASRFLP
ncbi:metal-dependent hydrolase [Candidatus Thiothrix sp. Deng01]|uniref:Metal-dependent hydrolase n=1 Tax=Candidatus Thiothrix phosphatis TaxID=3112415 RepID=A0ABU6CZI9_9GAMM|nr:metal-dependent hydrolase [Candidatus Thiothrix sp. Deng01]MEB4591472.1 metal-dependent hydrolase [Candidatus Thiothrix sp. Deng01]